MEFNKINIARQPAVHLLEGVDFCERKQFLD
jgi:hypothetical protein